MNTITIDAHTPPLLRPQVPNLPKALKVSRLGVHDFWLATAANAALPSPQTTKWWGITLNEFVVGLRAQNYNCLSSNTQRFETDVDGLPMEADLVWDRLHSAGLLEFDMSVMSTRYNLLCVKHKTEKSLNSLNAKTPLDSITKPVRWQHPLIMAGMTRDTQRLAYEMAVEYAHACVEMGTTLFVREPKFTVWPYRGRIPEVDPMLIAATNTTPDYTLNQKGTDTVNFDSVEYWGTRSFFRTDWLLPVSPAFKRLERLYYRAQTDEYGEASRRLHHAQLRVLTLGMFLLRNNAGETEICIPVLTP